jgi:hypothetical protein
MLHANTPFDLEVLRWPVESISVIYWGITLTRQQCVLNDALDLALCELCKSTRVDEYAHNGFSQLKA